jgi:pimeloyl-ACP methyl ester carboxylesterase
MEPGGAGEWSDPAGHEHSFVKSNGVRLECLDWEGTGPVLILIHGANTNPHYFDDLASAFTDRFRVIAYARRGHGRSDTVGPFDTTTLTEDLRGLMDALGISKAHLAGWSMGGNEITAMAGTYPDRVDRLVYLDAAYDWGDPVARVMFTSMPPWPDYPTTSFEAYRTAQQGLLFPGVRDTSQVESFTRAAVNVQGDGTVKSVVPESVEEAVFNALVSNRRDYTLVRAPALALYSTTFWDVSNGDPSLAAKNLAWERQWVAPFRTASMERIRREMPHVRIVTLPGTHPDFVFTSREQVVAEMRRFLE